MLRTHPAALEVVRTAIEALRKLAIDAQNAEVMAKAGAVEAALNAMLKSGDDAVAEEGGELIAQISMHAPEALLNTPGTVQALIGALHTGRTRPDRKNIARPGLQRRDSRRYSCDSRALWIT